MNSNPQDTHRLIQVSMGRIPADMVVVNGSVVNVYTKEVMKDCAVSICADRIARVGPEADQTIGTDTRVIDATGNVIIPGLIEGHTHLAGLYTAAEFIAQAMLGGTTSIIMETMEPFSVGGMAGVIDFLESYKEQPIKLWATAPAMVSISKAARGIDLEDLKTLLARDDIVGLGETYWQAIIQDPDFYLPILKETLKAGKLLEGHTAGASFDKLNAYAACQVTSCHEPINAQEVIERLRMGFYVMVREGSIRRDLAAIAKIKDANIDLRHMILSTDGVSPEDLLEKGYMDYLLQKAIDCGFDPLDAIQMATLNVAEHFRLDHMIGGIAPGRQADLLILPSLHSIRPTTVISKGQVIAQDGKPLAVPRKHPYSPQSLQTVHLNADKTAGDFEIRAASSTGTLQACVINMVSDLVTQASYEKMTVKNHLVAADLERDIIKIAAVDRTHHPGKQFNGLIKGFQMQSGALASSTAWDSSAIIAVGATDSDMALAINRIRELSGGVVVCDQGKVLTELALPIFGLMSELSLMELADKTKTINRVLAELGVPFSDPLLTLSTLTSAAIPFVRICEEGLVGLKDGRRMDLIL